MSTAMNWVAWHVYWDSNCHGREEIGYFQKEQDAEMARANFAQKNNIKEGGICCSNMGTLIKEEIVITS